MTTKINQPGAIVIIYNYNDRTGDIKLEESKGKFNINEIILNSSSLISVSTQKTKANPAGNFELRLAPSRNWVTAITPGSWCVILMSNKTFVKSDILEKTVDPKTFKMMGRIESVRCVTGVDDTGTIRTEYIVTGVDWGCVFNSVFYVDPLNREPDTSPQGMAGRFGYSEYLTRALKGEASTHGENANPNIGTIDDAAKTFVGPVNKNVAAAEMMKAKDDETTGIKIPTSLDNVDFLINLWGHTDLVTNTTSEITGLVTKSNQSFTIPANLAEYMGFVDNNGDVIPSNVIADLLYQKGGKLIDDDMYDDKDNSVGIIDPSTILNEHSMWQLLTSNCNPLINELIPEIRFNENGDPTLTLYNRVRPFTINDPEDIWADSNLVGDNGVLKVGNNNATLTRADASVEGGGKEAVAPFLSPYKFVRKIKIPTEDVKLCSYGTNWRDRVNFIEVNIVSSLYSDNLSGRIKLNSQFVDEVSINRDGLLSMMVSTNYVPKKAEHDSPLDTATYKYALKEWYFNTHKMFNGTISLIGQDQYIQVGDNIMVDAKVLNRNINFNSETKDPTFLLAHVESVSHSVSVGANGNRSFKTDINFVRGIMTDEIGEIIKAEDSSVGAVDQDTSRTPAEFETNTETIITRAELDPNISNSKIDIIKD